MARTSIMYVVCVRRSVDEFMFSHFTIQKQKVIFVVAVVFNVCVQASTQTDAMRVPVSRRRQMKNKSVLCRPFTMDQEIMCQLPSPSTESAGNYIKYLM